MNFKKIKTLFYFLFVADLAAGIVLVALKGIAFGIIACIVLLTINISVYTVILKMEKLNGTTRTNQKG